MLFNGIEILQELEELSSFFAEDKGFDIIFVISVLTFFVCKAINPVSSFVHNNNSHWSPS